MTRVFPGLSCPYSPGEHTGINRKMRVRGNKKFLTVGHLSALRLLLQLTQWISRIDALLQVGTKESPKTSHPLILRHVRQFMNEQSAVAPMAFANVDAVPQGHANRLRGDKPEFLPHASKQPIHRRDSRHRSQSHAVRV